MTGLDEALNAAFDGADENPGAEAPALADAAETAPDAEASAGDPEAQAPAADDDAEPSFNREKYLAEHPELAPIAKQFQADYTRKMQELAEQRKQFEGLDESDIAGIRNFNNLAATNPAAAADWLAQQAEALRGAQAPDPYADQFFATDAERIAFERITRLEQQIQASENRQIHATVERSFDQLGQTYGVAIPVAEREQVINQMAAQGVPLGMLETFWQGQNVKRLIEAAARKARDEASGVVQRKAGIGGAPSGIAAREVAGTREPQSLMEALEMAIPT